MNVYLSGTIREAGGPDGHVVLGLVSSLCAALEGAGVRYCHWKSNHALDRSANGENDLDLLVARADVHRFTEILLGLGFKELLDQPRKRFPGILHYYGLDRDSGRFVHVHAHYQLVIGDDATKNYRLPVEVPYLISAIRYSLFRVPEIEFEFILFVIRMVLKHATWDSIVMFRGRLSESEREELTYLSDRADHQRVQVVLKEHLPFIDDGLFIRCVRSTEPACWSGTRIRTARMLHRRLVGCARRPQGADTFLRLWRRSSQKILRLLPRRRSGKRLATGGALVALVGGDGAGKSTLVNELYAWLSRSFLVRKVHLGKPRHSAASLIVKGLVRAGRSVGVISRKRMHPSVGGGSETADVGGYTTLIWHVLTARDRYRAYIRARRFASVGGIVVCDRYPHPLIQTMDGPRTARIAQLGRRGRLARYLVDLEEGYYERIFEPDVLIVLRIDPKIAVQRRAGDDPAVVRARSNEVWQADWGRTSAGVVEASRPPWQVLLEVKSLVWSGL
jgi:thymidylate kinase